MFKYHAVALLQPSLENQLAIEIDVQMVIYDFFPNHAPPPLLYFGNSCIAAMLRLDSCTDSPPLPASPLVVSSLRHFALPPDQELLSDLTSARWKYTASGILLEEKEETIKRIGRSPDAGEAVVLACYPGGDAKIETDSYHRPGRRAGLGR